MSEQMQTRAHAIPLAFVQAGKRVKIQSISTGREFQGRLAAMGLVPGEEITVLRNCGHGPFLLALKGSRIMLGLGMALKIFVV